MSVESEVLEIIRPTKEETARINQIADSLMEKVLGYIESNNIDAEPTYVGSVAKGTNLGNPDLDLFIMFPTDAPLDYIIKTVLKMGEIFIDGKENYANHPYSSGVYEGLEVDMVPCYHISTTDNLMTAVDRSPFHAKYIKSRSDRDMCDQIILMKRFMKGIGTYGAEPDVRGFSGYMCELITIHYGGFIPALEAASKWREGTKIVMEKEGPAMSGPLVLYDPVDSKRNVASAVHIDTMFEFVSACRAYLARPSKQFFFPNERQAMSREEIREYAEAHGTRLMTVTFKKPDVNDDNLKAQVWKSHIGIEEKLNLFTFNCVRAVHSIKGDRIVLVFEIETDTLSKRVKRIGPPVWTKSSDSFLSKWADNDYGAPFIENGKWCVVGHRLYQTAEAMIRKEGPICGIGKDIDPDTMVITTHERTLKETDALMLTELLAPKHRWEY